MLAAADGNNRLVTWLVERGATLDHTAKYGLSALMLAVVRGHVDVVRSLAGAGANVSLRGTGAPGFAEKTALDLAIALNHHEMVEILRFTERTRE
jgi:ankyrin repeat protein